MIRQAIGGASSNEGRLTSIPAPVGGWNTRDSLADMGRFDAVVLDNFFPRNSDVMLRKGRQLLATLPVGREIRTILGYKNPMGAAQQFAATQNGIYDITIPGAPVLATTSTKGDWEYENVTTSGGNFLMACNGQDKLKHYNGAVWTDIDGVSVPAVTGITTTDIVNISRYKNRVVFVKKNSMSFYYLPTNAIAGAAVEFPLGTVFTKGGFLMATATWTIDGGNGPDDYFIAVTSEGEIAVYVGPDLASSDFRKVGTFQLPPPIGRRCFKQLADDVLLMTRGAIYPLSKSLGRGLLDKRLAITDKIDKAYNDYSQQFGSIFGWEMAFFPEAQMLLVNIPVLNYAPQNVIYAHQFAVNLMTNSWARFTGWNAECFSSFNGRLYCALHNQVWEAWSGTSDEGGEIVAVAKTAFSALRTSGNKHVTMVRPLVQVSASVTLKIGIDVDYESGLQTATAVTYVANPAIWNLAKWNQAKWNSSTNVLADWTTVLSKMGRVASVRLRVSSKSASMSWISTDLIAVDGGFL